MNLARLVAHVSLLGLCASLATGCGLLKKKNKDEGSSSSGSSEDKGDKGSSGSSEDTEEVPEGKPFKGCKMPTHDIKADWTVTKGCKTKLKNAFYVNEGATLTIEEGVKIEFETDSWIWVDYGKMIVKGTEKDPVVFTSANKSPAPGDYVGIGFREKTMAGTSIDHLTMEYAGSKASSGEGAIKLESMRQSGRISITNTKITKSAQFGVVTEDNGGFAKFENNTLSDNKNGSMNIKPDAIGSLGHGNKFGAEIHVKGGDVTESGAWPAVDVAYMIDGDITVGNESKPATLTLPDKAVLKVGQGHYLSIGEHGPGALVARGVTFTSASPSPSEGDWATIFLYPKTNGTTIDGCTFEYFGNNAASAEGAITFYNSPAKDLTGVTIKNNTFRKGKQAAMSSDDHQCAPFDKQANKAEGVALCKPEG